MTDTTTRTARVDDRPEAGSSLRACVRLVLEHAMSCAPGADGAAVSACGPHGRLRTLGDTGALARAGCEEQYRLDDGPTPAALVQDTVVVPDLADDPRWPAASARLRELGVRSALCLRLETVDDGPIGVLSVFGRRPHALSADIVPALERVRLMVSVALTALRTREQVAQLEHAVRSNRDIGVAMGIVMAHRLVTRDEAFELLRRASQHQHRKLVEVADEVIRTGLLEYSDTSFWSEGR